MKLGMLKYRLSELNVNKSVFFFFFFLHGKNTVQGSVHNEFKIITSIVFKIDYEFKKNSY